MNSSSKFRLNLENQMILLYSKALRIKSLVIRGCFIMSESYKLQNQSNFFTKLSDKIFFLWKLHSKRGTDPFTGLHNRRKAFYFLAKALHCYSYYFHTVLLKPVEFWLGSIILFFMVFSLKMFWFCLFSMKHSYVITTQISSDVMNFLFRSKKLYNPIKSQKMTLTVFSSFFC